AAVGGAGRRRGGLAQPQRVRHHRRRHGHPLPVEVPLPMTTADKLIEAARALSGSVDRLRFSAPVTHVYNPLEYAWAVHASYLRRYGEGRKRVVFVGMNPGPFGMAQTGVPFGEIASARDWLGLEGPVGQPAQPNPKRPVE